jgi:hypothetical protein
MSRLFLSINIEDRNGRAGAKVPAARLFFARSGQWTTADGQGDLPIDHALRALAQAEHDADDRVPYQRRRAARPAHAPRDTTIRGTPPDASHARTHARARSGAGRSLSLSLSVSLALSLSLSLSLARSLSLSCVCARARVCVCGWLAGWAPG